MSLQMLLQYNTDTHIQVGKGIHFMHSGSQEYACKRLMVNFVLRRMKYGIYYKYKEAVTQHSLLFPFISDWQLQFGASCIRSSTVFPFQIYFYSNTMEQNVTSTAGVLHAALVRCCTFFLWDKVTKNSLQTSAHSFGVSTVWSGKKIGRTSGYLDTSRFLFHWESKFIDLDKSTDMAASKSPISYVLRPLMSFWLLVYPTKTDLLSASGVAKMSV